MDRALIVDTISGLDVKPASYIIFGGTCGFVGSVVDSILVIRFVNTVSNSAVGV